MVEDDFMNKKECLAIAIIATLAVSGIIAVFIIGVQNRQIRMAEVRSVLDPYFESLGVTMIVNGSIQGDGHTVYLWAQGSYSIQNSAVQQFSELISQFNIMTLFCWQVEYSVVYGFLDGSNAYILQI